jgi:hypothetical protein
MLARKKKLAKLVTPFVAVCLQMKRFSFNERQRNFGGVFMFHRRNLIRNDSEKGHIFDGSRK